MMNLFGAAVVLFVFAAVGEGGLLFRSNQECEDGWKYFVDSFGSRMCFRVTPTASSWQKAQEHCGRDIAHLLNLDPISRFTNVDRFTEREESLTDYLFQETNGQFWSGMNVQNGRLMWDSYGPEYVLNRRDISWTWAEGQPAIQDGDVCGQVIQGRRIIAPSTTVGPDFSGSGETSSGEGADKPNTTTASPTSTTVVEVYNGVNSVRLSSCGTELPFVCQKPVMSQEVKISSFCPDGWVGNLYLPYCFRIVKDPMSVTEARRACQETEGGELYKALPYTFNFTMAVNVLLFYTANDEYFEVTPSEFVWIDGGPVDNDGVIIEDQCYAVKRIVIDQPFNTPGTANCEEPFPFVCVKPTEIQEKIQVEVRSPYFDQNELQSLDPFTMLSLTAMFDRGPSENEVMFIRTPTRLINSTQDYSQVISLDPDKLYFSYNVTQSDKTVFPYDVNLWFPSYNEQNGARKKRFMDSSTEKKHHYSYSYDKKQHHSSVKKSHYLSKKKHHDLKKITRRKKRAATMDDSASYQTESYSIDVRRNYHSILLKSLQEFLTRKGLEEESIGIRLHASETSPRNERQLTNFAKLGNRYQYLMEQTVVPNSRQNFSGIKEQLMHSFPAKFGKSLLRRKRGLSLADVPNQNQDGFADIVNFNQLLSSTGYYSFGVYTINPPSYTETDPVLLRFSERDWYIYVVTADMNPQDEFFRAEEMEAFNLYREPRYIGLLGEYAYGAMERAPTFPAGQIDQPSLMRFYKAIPEHITGSTVKFRVFMNLYSSSYYIGEAEQELLPVLDQHWRTGLAESGFLLDTIEVRSTVACPQEKIDINGTVITFPSTEAGETAFTWERCIQGTGAFASRKCLGGYDDGVHWGNITFNTGCGEFPALNQSNSTADLKILSEVMLNTTNFEDVLNDTTVLTSPDIELTEADIIYTAEILYNYWQFEGADPGVLDSVYDVANNVLETFPSIIEAAQRITNAANRIIESVEEITNNADLFGNTTLRVVRSFLATDIWEQAGQGTLIIGLKLHQEEGNDTIADTDLFNVETPTDADVNLTDTAIFLDEDLLNGRNTRTVFQIYSKTTLFNNVNSDRFELVSKVAAARLEIDGVQVTELENNTVTAVFKPSKDDDRIVCAYWDYRADEGAGGWRTDGCNKTVTTDGRITCECDHLTNFAVLIDLEAYTISDTNKLILEIVTKVGLIISIIGLGLTILTFVMFKHLRSGRGQQVLINLALAMLCSALIFLVGMDRTEDKVGCKVVAALLHYFILVSFMWMLVEGILQYLRFVKVLGTYIPNFMLKSMIPAWGIPIIPVVIVAAIDHELYFGGNGYCWLDRDAMLYAFIIPVAVILFANIVVFLLVLCSLFRRKSRGMKSNQSERKMAFLHFQAAVSIFVVLGLTWIFGFLAIDGARVIFHYVFAILNAFQGFFIFLLFTAREKQIRKAWKKMCCKRSAGKATSSSTGTDVPRRKTSVDTNSTGIKSNSGKSDYSYNGNSQNVSEFHNVGYEP